MPVAFGVAVQVPETVLLYALTAAIHDSLAPRRQTRLEPCAVGQMGTFLHWVQSLCSLCGPCSSPCQCLLFAVSVPDRSTEEGKRRTVLISRDSHQLEFFFNKENKLILKSLLFKI